MHLIKRAADIEALRRRERNEQVWIEQGIYEPCYKWEQKDGTPRKIIDELPINQYWKSLFNSTMRKVNPSKEPSKFNVDKSWFLEDVVLKECRNRTVKIIRSSSQIHHPDTVARFLLAVRTHNSHLDESFMTILEQMNKLIDKNTSWADRKQKKKIFRPEKNCAD